MKVLHTIPHMDSRTGGPPSCALASALATARAGDDAVLVYAESSTSQGLPETQESADGVTFRPVRYHRKGRLAGRYAFVRGMAAELRSQIRIADVVHVHCLWSWPSLVSLAVARRQRARVVLSPHEQLTDFDLSDGEMPVPGSVRRALARFLLRRVDAIVFSSELERGDSGEALEGFGGEVCVIWHALPVSAGLEPPATDRPRSAWRLGLIGRLHEKKNVELALRALSDLGASYSLDVAGSGPAPYERELRELVQDLGVEDRVTWLGHVQGDEKTRFFSSIDVELMPSTYECFGISAAEALTNRRPVVLAPKVGATEIVDRFGGGVVMRDVTAAELARSVRSVTAPDDYERYVDETARAAAAFGLDEHGSKLNELYQRLAGGRRPPSGSW